MTFRTAITTTLLGYLFMWGCDTKTKNVDSCGDSFLDPGEECDGPNLDYESCASLGYYNAVGTLRCLENCTFDKTDCGGICGDGAVDDPQGEQCDGGNLHEQTCSSLGFAAGALACDADCQFDVTNCQSLCGNGLKDPTEECDDGNAQSFDGCSNTCRFEEGFACTDDNPSICTSVCGDLLVAGDEECDGTELGDATCADFGEYVGILECRGDCTIDSTGCYPPCGDEIIQESFGEDCDGSVLDGATCVSQGYSHGSGALSCTDECQFDETACIPKSTNADLSTLTVSSGTLMPAFSAGTTSYAVTVPTPETTLTVTATVADPYATVAFMPTQPMTLVEGNNPATVTVTAESGAQNVYTMVITRLSPNDYGSPNIGGLKYVPAGTFQRDATVTNLSTVSAFRMSRYEITRAQWTAVTGWVDPSNGTSSSGTSDPVQKVGWYDAIAFCNKLSLLEGLTPVYTVSGVNFSTLTYAQIPTSDNATWNAVTANWAANGYRLPTEMEWMWAAMGADTGAPGVTNTTGYAKAFAGSTGSNAIDDYAWYSTNSTSKTHPAGTKLPNELGLYDLSGNVWEWNWDWSAAYPTGTVTDYRGPASGSNRVEHGAGFGSYASDCSLAYLLGSNPHYRFFSVGFRVVRP
ncbi:SUMF1/EgtB/PvdO family nonheme iron enzyme [Myxococcota bacterium]|nr:SUMF1/EgtB/PvdO family nonheme iron enzyme [Myxococcota bacterium]